MNHDKNMVYIHPGPVRVWHWINALAFIILILTGLQIRFADAVTVISFGLAVDIHEYTGWVLIFNWFLWLLYYLGSGKITIYIPNVATIITGSIRQAKFYGYGFFKGEKNPHVMTPINKFNPMQQQAYAAIMMLLIPIQLITGLFLWRIELFQNYIDFIGGVRIIDTIHMILCYFFISFMAAHMYLATLGHTPLAHLIAMITGWEEHH